MNQFDNLATCSFKQCSFFSACSLESLRHKFISESCIPFLIGYKRCMWLGTKMREILSFPKDQESFKLYLKDVMRFQRTSIEFS